KVKALESEIGPAAQIDDSEDQRLVHRHVGRAKALDAGFVSQGLAKRRAQHQPRVLHRMVAIDLEVALDGHLQVKKPVAAEGGQHVVEKTNARLEPGRSFPVEVERETDLGLLGRPFPGDNSLLVQRIHSHPRFVYGVAAPLWSRLSMASAWAGSPSSLARAFPTSPMARTDAGLIATTLERSEE